ncbi:hypothetical protein ACQVBX_08355 [Dyella sp. KULCS107]|uniref:hypothetical protein n=1 Tax=Dyella sp. KULCS107 TaxID=3422216 RepID=UPI003D6E2FA7
MSEHKQKPDARENTSATKPSDAPGDAGRNEAGAGTAHSNADRLDLIEQADDRTEESARERARDVGAQTPGDPGDLLSQPLGEGNYVREGDREEPLRGQDGNDDEGR